jgi:hypothetical protein
VEGGDGLERLLLLPVVVQVQLEHELLHPSDSIAKSATETSNHEQQIQKKKNPNSAGCKQSPSWRQHNQQGSTGCGGGFKLS